MACLKNGIASGLPLRSAVRVPVVKACKASSDDVLASSSGVSNFWIELSDSPNFPRTSDTALSNAFSTFSFPFVRTSSRTSFSPVWQFIAFRPTTYWLPKLAMETPSTALLPDRWHTSRAKSCVNLSSGLRPISCNESATFRSERILRKGDCSRSTASACFRVSSKTRSPVLLSKSARITVSRSLNPWVRNVWKKAPPAAAMTRSVTGTTTLARFISVRSGRAVADAEVRESRRLLCLTTPCPVLRARSLTADRRRAGRQAAIFLQRLVDDVFQFGWNLRVDPDGRYRRSV